MQTITGFILFCLLRPSWAQVEMSWPYPINSNLDPAVPYDERDFSYTRPLYSNGSNYPCKGYQTQTPYVSKATYVAGQTYNMTLTGAATEGGGSCQLALSYDNGETFKVIESMIGGCPLVSAYNFTIPSFAPSSTEALLAWVWYNEVGDRDMYMNCARVTIQTTTTGRHRRALAARQDSMDSLPDMFVCNIGNGCTTIEEEDVQFPSPGSNVIYGTDAYSTVGGSGYSTSATATATGSTTSQPTTSFSTTTPTTLSRRTSGVSATSTSSAAAASTSSSGSCTVGSFTCNSTSTFSQCVEDADGSTSYTYMGSVAAGTQCVNGTISAQNSGSCSTDGAIVCGSTGTTFYMCDHGGLIDMGSVADGTECVDGAIVYYASSSC